MNKNIVVSLFAAAGLMLASCGKDSVQGTKNTAEYAKLMNTWGSKCAGVGTDKIGLSKASYVKYFGSDFTEVTEFYGVGDCKDAPVAYVKYTGTFEIQGDSDVVPGSKQVLYHYQNVQKVAVKTELKGLVDAAPVKKVPGDEYNLVRVDGDAVFFGDLGLRGATTPDKRPTKLTKDSYGKTEKKID